MQLGQLSKSWHTPKYAKHFLNTLYFLGQQVVSLNISSVYLQKGGVFEHPVKGRNNDYTVLIIIQWPNQKYFNEYSSTPL